MCVLNENYNLADMQINIIFLSIFNFIGFAVQISIFSREFGQIFTIIGDILRAKHSKGNSTTEMPEFYESLQRNSIPIGIISFSLLMIFLSFLLFMSTRFRGFLALVFSCPFYIATFGILFYCLYTYIEGILSWKLKWRDHKIYDSFAENYEILLLILLSFQLFILHMYIWANIREFKRYFRDRRKVADVEKAGGSDDEKSKSSKSEEKKIRKRLSTPTLRRQRPRRRRMFGPPPPGMMRRRMRPPGPPGMRPRFFPPPPPPGMRRRPRF